MLKNLFVLAIGVVPVLYAQLQVETAPLPIPPNITGSVATGPVTPEPLTLALRDAIERGLKYNFGVVNAGQDIRAARAERLRALHDLLPTVTSKIDVTNQQVDLAAFGFSNFPGIPSVIGPFTVYDARAYLTQNVFDLNARRKLHARDQDVRSADLLSGDIREQVILAIAGLYLQAQAGKARIDSAKAQVATAETLFKNAKDRKAAGTSPAIDVLRAQVQFQSLEQREIYYEGENAKQILALERAIGLPEAQKIALVEPDLSKLVPLAPMDEMLKTAYANRRDYQAAQASLRAAELDRSAARAENYPTADLNANYGGIGLRPNDSHGSYSLTGEVNIPIFQGGKVKADVLAADAVVQLRRAALENLRGDIENEVRTTQINIENAARQVEVARSNVDLSRQELMQSQDRFRAGVTNNVEVVQAQEAVAAAEESLIVSLFNFNLARATLVRAEGLAEQVVNSYLKGK
jgi:outer membrane protein TolC